MEFPVNCIQLYYKHFISRCVFQIVTDKSLMIAFAFLIRIFKVQQQYQNTLKILGL